MDHAAALSLSSQYKLSEATTMTILKHVGAAHMRTDKHGVTRGTWEKFEGFVRAASEADPTLRPRANVSRRMES